ncbi:hypothetical protein [Nesterenkonia halotolerans]|uniref:PH domain-containing protein n=1 Tax=Nesterenkonia halotolerans TaxID=225325 RepID=A0ABR9J4G6_9MICC|nr:hypothetical protein [Nesterenkonia halotolerans]MBE1513732.1 hypothetical protein [Nesterenkonia halotolerans]
MSNSSSQLVSDVGLNRRVSVPLFVILGLSALPAFLFAPPGLGITVLVLNLLIGLAVAFLRVKITADNDGLHASCMKVFRTSFRWAEITAVEEGRETGVLEGAGYRVLPSGRVGLLVGGATIEVQDARKAYVLSVADPENVVTEVRRRLDASRTER